MTADDPTLPDMDGGWRTMLDTYRTKVTERGLDEDLFLAGSDVPTDLRLEARGLPVPARTVVPTSQPTDTLDTLLALLDEVQA
jgi:hypothetical protein